MPMVRNNPLPAGRYWIYIRKGASSDIFELWLAQHADVVTIERKETSGDLWPIIKPDETFYVFVTKDKVVWPRGVGFPNTADATVKTPEDTKTRGPTPTYKDVLHDIEETAAEAAAKAKSLATDWTTGLVIAAAIYWLLNRSDSARRNQRR